MTTTTDSISVQAAKEHPLPELRQGQVLGGRYEIQTRVGEGFVGAVYKAKDSRGGAQVAIKLLRKALLRADLDEAGLQQEIDALRKTSHPGIVQPLAGGTHEGTLFVVSEFVEGQSLRGLMTEYKGKGEDLPSRDVQWIMIDVLEVLRAAHNGKPAAVHQDLKPENIILSEETGPDGKPRPRVRVTDFLVARVLSPRVFENLNREGAWYLPPELQAFGAAAPANIDTYSIGAIFYEMIAGLPPIGSYDVPSVIRHGEISEKIDDLIELALAGEGEKRYQTADDMLAAMKSTLSALPGMYDPRQRVMVIALAATVVVAVVAGLWFVMSQPTESELRETESKRREAVRTSLRPADLSPKAPTDPKLAEMIWIQDGKFIQGAWRAYDDGMPGEFVERQTEVKGYWIDKYESAHADDGSEESRKPLRELSYSEAEALCDGQGKRLCSEEEWEKACKGPDNLIYPYGDEFKNEVCGGSGWFLPGYTVTRYQDCRSGYGVLGLGGGLLEWTSSKDRENYVVKGGAVGSDLKGTRCAGRSRFPASEKQSHIGLRCCAN